ncbi:MAG: YaiI/YqxD family protein [Parasphingorhabdus sp.]
MTFKIQIYVDADACPVKDETCRVAYRHEVPVVIVSNSHFRIPIHPLISRIVVSDAFDAADDYIADKAQSGSIVVTSDILLADRCLKAQASVLAPNGRAFTEDSIGSAVATRAIMTDLRAGMETENIGGPPPFTKSDRSRFLSSLDELLNRLKRQV